MAVTLMFACSHDVWGQSVLQGHVLNTDSTAVIAARVELIDSSGGIKLDATTDSSGGFRIPLAAQVRPGLFFLTVSSLGYMTVARRPVRIGKSERVLVIVWMSPGVILLQPVNVVAQRRYRPDVNEEFADRAYWIKRTGLGRVLEHDELQRMVGMNLVHAVTRIPGVQWQRIGVYDAVRIRDCVPAVYLDRLQVDVSQLSTILAIHLEGIEVYRSPGEVPAEYATRAGTCGVILAWTNMRVENARPLTWKRVGTALALGVIIIFVSLSERIFR